ncbi:hypothetical protein ABTE40_20955, partial [Acinetobacter baumannii]
GVRQFLRQAWSKWWVKLAAILGGLYMLGWFLLWVLFARDLPSVDGLRVYEPPRPSNVRDVNGTPIYSFARERRVELSYDEYPPLLI